MSTRRIVLIGVGLLAAAVVGMVAAQLLAIGLGWSPPLTSALVESATDQLRNAPQPGVTMLIGLGLALLAVVLAIVWFTDLIGPRRRTVPMPLTGGRTRVDCPTLEASLERELNLLDLRTRVDVSVRRKGRTRVVVHTADPSRTGPPQAVADKLQQLIDARHLPLSVTRLTVAPATGKAKRQRVA